VTGLTDRQAEVVGIMVARFEELGAWPTTRELAEDLGGAKALSLNAVHLLLRSLISKGFVEHTSPTKARSYRVVRLADGTPVVARLVPVTAAGRRSA